MYYKFDKANSFRPYWQEYMSIEEFKASYGSFYYMKFTGPGWYTTKTDSLLVLPSQQEEDNHYWFYMWNHAEALEAFKQIVDAPRQSVKT